MTRLARLRVPLGFAFGALVWWLAAPTVKNLDAITPDWSVLEWSKYIYIPMNKRVAIPNMARGCPFTCSFCSQWKFWRDYRIRDPKKVVDEIETAHKRGQPVLSLDTKVVAANGARVGVGSKIHFSYAPTVTTGFNRFCFDIRK